jgi:hypothetical protein
MALVVAGAVAIGIHIHVDPDWYGSDPVPTAELMLGMTVLAGFFLVPCLIAFLLCRWTSWFAPLAMLPVAFGYFVFTAGAALTFGAPLLPSGICLLVAAIVRLPGKGPTSRERKLTSAEVLGDDGTWGASKQRNSGADVLAFLRGQD